MGNVVMECHNDFQCDRLKGCHKEECHSYRSKLKVHCIACNLNSYTPNA